MSHPLEILFLCNANTDAKDETGISSPGPNLSRRISLCGSLARSLARVLPREDDDSVFECRYFLTPQERLSGTQKEKKRRKVKCDKATFSQEKAGLSLFSWTFYPLSSSFPRCFLSLSFALSAGRSITRGEKNLFASSFSSLPVFHFLSR